MFRRFEDGWRFSIGALVYIRYFNRMAWPERGSFIRGKIGRFYFDRTIA
jgi:hypothetical protein